MGELFIYVERDLDRERKINIKRNYGIEIDRGRERYREWDINGDREKWREIEGDQDRDRSQERERETSMMIERVRGKKERWRREIDGMWMIEMECVF